MLILILLVCLLVGVLVGATGIGGILMLPALMLLGGVEAHQAMGTALPYENFKSKNHLAAK